MLGGSVISHRLFRLPSQLQAPAGYGLAQRLEVLLPVWFHAVASAGVALGEEPLQIFRGINPGPPLPLLQALPGSDPQPGAERHALPTRLLREPVSVLIRDNQLYPGHPAHLLYWGYVYVAYHETTGQAPSEPLDVRRFLGGVGVMRVLRSGIASPAPAHASPKFSRSFLFLSGTESRSQSLRVAETVQGQVLL